MGEVGTSLGIRSVVWVCRLAGRPVGRVVVSVVALYYVVFATTARRASRQYLERMGLSTSFRDVYGHIRHFAWAALDRVFFVAGERGQFQVGHHGADHLTALARTGQGAILLGAHLGSFEAMRCSGRRVHVVGYFKNARKINEALERINPESNVRLVEIEPGSVAFVLAIREIIQGGGLVGILGDRVVGDGRTVLARFLGSHARFSAGPFHLAAIVGCPVYLAFGLYGGGNSYDLYCEPFAERVQLPRGGRTEALARYAQDYADRLEHYCRLAPTNWFNFYDFWEAAT